MVEAARTTASPAAIWAIVITATVLLAFWLTAIMLADASQVRASGPRRTAGEAEPVPGGARTGGSVPGARAAQLPAQRSGDADRAERSYAGPAGPEEDETGR